MFEFTERKAKEFIHWVMKHYDVFFIENAKEHAYSVYLNGHQQKRWMAVQLIDRGRGINSHIKIIVNCKKGDFTEEELKDLKIPTIKQRATTSVYINNHLEALHYKIYDDVNGYKFFQQPNFKKMIDKAQRSFIKRQEKVRKKS
ncbi:hypothetical protein J9303_10185 [Bacillaceae bacterium Marseille-Q3522]|nr:hypothetical protein [Bacillaceae bacterium Marseille-Q3522]